MLEAREITRSFGHVEALRGASFAAYPGEVVALVGDNGAGKSSLTRILVGADQPDSGEILIDGRPTVFSSPLAAQQEGVGVVYQDLALATDLDIPANLYLGRELMKTGLLGKLGFIDQKAMRAGTAKTYERFGVKPGSLGAPVSQLSGGQRQSVAVARSIAFGGRILFMDEPTAALGVLQTAKVLDLIRRVRDEGTAVVLISHNMTDVLDVADRVEVLRLGRRVATFSREQATLEVLVGAMTGQLDERRV
ncbi:MAG: simple sugar transport system ATP-binding protein [Actinomycetota bacterium]|nr:simple sugar transport system ATP-binding protein [Actinomycetota bacterium]